MALEEAFIERRFEAGEAQVFARFYAPILAPGGEYRCRWEIEWPSGTQRHYACGIDGVQALMLAMRAVHSDLAASDAYRAGALTYLNQRDLDLPPTWEADLLSKAGQKPD
jgi:hypothetical protein